MADSRVGRRPRRGQRSVAMLLLPIFVAASVVSCSDDDSSFDYLRLQLQGEPTLTISKKGVLIRGIIVFFHGPDEDEFSVASSSAYKDTTAALADAGFAIVSSKAGGNAFDDPVTVDMYRQVSLMAMDHFRIANLFFLSQSSGAIPALKLLALDSAHVRGLAAIRPKVGVGDILQIGLPENGLEQIPVQALAGKNIRLYVNENDQPPVTGGNSSSLTDQLGQSAKVSVVSCSGEQGGSSCLQGNDIAKWFTSLDRAK